MLHEIEESKKFLSNNFMLRYFVTNVATEFDNKIFWGN